MFTTEKLLYWVTAAIFSVQCRIGANYKRRRRFNSRGFETSFPKRQQLSAISHEEGDSGSKSVLMRTRFTPFNTKCLFVDEAHVLNGVIIEYEAHELTKSDRYFMLILETLVQRLFHNHRAVISVYDDFYSVDTNWLVFIEKKIFLVLLICPNICSSNPPALLTSIPDCTAVRTEGNH